MLFAVPAADLTPDSPMQTMELEFKTRETICPPPPIPFRILPDDQPLNADPQTLGENGNCGLSWLDMHPASQPSLDDNPAEEGNKKDEAKAEEKKEEQAEEKKADEKAADAPAEEKKAE